MQNLFTVDCEEWFHGAGVAAEQRPFLRRSVRDNTLRLLELLARYGASATFFTLADVAQEFPNLISEIQAAGHELASHGSGHEFVYKLSPEQFRHTLLESKHSMESIIGTPLGGYRAPYFSLTAAAPWAFEIIRECGFWYDASVAPVRNHRYGIADALRSPYTIPTSAGELQELPMTTMFPHRFALTGGFYFRFFPVRQSIHAFHSLNKKNKRGIFYIHPWEIGDFSPDAAFATPFLRWRMLHNLSETYTKVERLLKEVEFVSVEQTQRDKQRLF